MTEQVTVLRDGDKQDVFYADEWETVAGAQDGNLDRPATLVFLRDGEPVACYRWNKIDGFVTDAALKEPEADGQNA